MDTLHALWTDPHVRKHLWDDLVIPPEMAEAVVEASVRSFADHAFGQWIVTRQNDDACIGFAGLRYVDGTDEIEALYGFYPAFCGQGYATEALTTVLRYGLETLKLPEIFADIDAPNAASIRVAEKAGMAFVTRYEREGLPTVRYVAQPGGLGRA